MKLILEEITIEHPEVQKWTKGHKILSVIWDDEKLRLYVATKDKNSAYYLLRFFKLGINIECSQDIYEPRDVDIFIPQLMIRLV